MRNVTLALLALTSAVSTAQDYLGNAPVWLVHSMCSAPLPCIANDTYNYYTTGDSLIGGVTWTKVVREGVVTYTWQAAPPTGTGCEGMHPYGADFHGIWLIRQEGRQMRIWVNDTDELLYDFDLHVNDLLPLSWNNWNDDITVLAVDSVLIGTEMRARFELGNSWAQYLIEGVGSTNGLFEPISNFLECGYGLDCFGMGDESYYPGTWSGSCFITTGIEQLAASDRMEIAPNPARDVISIAGVRPGEVITVHDAIGRVVVRERALTGTMRLDLSDLPVGPYTVVQGAGRQRLFVVR